MARPMMNVALTYDHRRGGAAIDTSAPQPINSVPSTYQLHTLNLSILYPQPINSVPSTYQLHTLNLSTLYPQPINSVPLTYQLYTLNLSTSYSQPINSILSTYQLCTLNLSTLYPQPIYTHGTLNSIPHKSLTPLKSCARPPLRALSDWAVIKMETIVKMCTGTSALCTDLVKMCTGTMKW